ncbi:PP2C family protein-serine/threonine phosphatase [Actinacidiphila acidipaludis]|uniref:Serine/threonine-protein phosphatase n=1 Tax=Actinacidiphila acidipaludis TaxID=2873382 RepID=A0ABS7Q9E2_9ACTN|nr:PP2C family protein-serine/threonine phosphatase [Streptomyces acidipaludis]MBY8878627.1 serine/threonine-protein phosphatase [Streptomyces acidipaludis]
MEAMGSPGRSRMSRALRSPWGRLAAPLAVVAVLLSADLAGGTAIRIGGLMIAVPALCAVFLGPGQILVITVVTMVCVVLAAQNNHQFDTTNFPVVMATVVLIGVGAVAGSALRVRRERQLAQVRWVATAAQQLLLRPLPGRLGPLTLASLYMAAEEEAAIGGDLYAATVLDNGDARLMVGDVQGKGMAAVEVANFLLAGFRRAARRSVDLPDLPCYLDKRLREDLADAAESALPAPDGVRTAPRSGPRTLEGFVTAVLVDVAAGCTRLRIANCGHPPPLLVRDSTVRRLMPEVPALPLGLGDIGEERHDVDTYPMEPGDILLLYTDGVTETRDEGGVFYPLADRLCSWSADTPDVLLRHLHDDLLAYAAEQLTDDVAMVAIQRAA